MGIQKTLTPESEDKDVGVTPPSRKTSRRLESYKKSFRDLGARGRREIFPFGQAGGNLDEAQGTPRGEGQRLRGEHNSHAGSLGVGGSGFEKNLIGLKGKGLQGTDVAGTLDASYGKMHLHNPNLVARTISQRYYKDGSENLIQTPFPLAYLGRNQKNYDPETMLCLDARQSTGLMVADFRNDEGLRIRKSQISPNLAARRHSETDISTMPPLCLLTPETYDYKDSNANAKKRNTNEILSLLWEALDSEQREEWRFGEPPPLLTEEVLQQRMYESIIQGQMERKSTTSRGQLPSKNINPSLQMRELWKHLQSRYSPQGQEQIEQLLRELTDTVQRMSLEGTLARKRESERDAQTQNEEQSRSLRIRRLTPCECERLQGFPDNWTSGISDTQRYKCLGNAVTTNVIIFLGKLLLEKCS